MKIQFGEYTYFDPNSDNFTVSGGQKGYEKYAFDSNYFNQLLSDRRYEEACDYAKQYHFHNPEKQQEFIDKINSIQTNGRILSACYSNISSETEKQGIDFIDKVFNNGGLEHLSDKNNIYAKNFIAAKKNIGSTDEAEATSLSIQFAPKKRTFFGIDWLAKDNDNNIDNFYEISGLNEQVLKNNGVSVIKQDGYTTLKFDKSNPLANTILNNVYTRDQSSIFSYDERSTMVGDWYNIVDNVVKGYDKNGKEIIRTNNKDLIKLDDSLHDIADMQQVVVDAKEIKQKYLKTNSLTEKQYTSTIGGNIDDNLVIYQQQLANGEIDKTEFNRLYKINCGDIDNKLRSIGSGEYQMYSNKFNDESSDETLNFMDNKQRNELKNIINAADKKNIYLTAMTSNGLIGTLITITPEGLTQEQIKKLSGDSDDEYYNGKTIQVFIPGLFQEQAQQKLNRDSKTRAILETNRLQDFNYEYKTRNKHTLVYDGAGGYLYDGRTINTDDAIDIINKDMIVRDGCDNLMFNYMNNDGQLIDKESYEMQARRLAVAASNNIDPNTSLSDTKGNALTETEIFSHSEANYDDYFNNKVNYKVHKKLANIYDIYNQLMDAILYYK